MGLFDFLKKNKTDNQKSIDFYSICVADYHKTAMQDGVAKKGLIFIPELIPIGEKTILAFLKDPFFQMQFGSNPQTYYYVIMSLSLQAGIVFGDKWHVNYSALKNGFVDEIIEEGPADAAIALMQANFSEAITQNQGNVFFRKIFIRWMELHEPYWKLADPREYTFKAMLAAYQLGVSMILEKYGY